MSSKTYVKDRIREPSTWAGLGGIITAVSMAWANRDWVSAIAAIVSGVAIVKGDVSPR